MLSRRRGGRFNGTFRRRRDALLLQLPVMLLMVSQIAASTYVVGARMDEDDAGGFSIPCVQTTESLRVVESKFILRGISKAHQGAAGS